MAEETAMEWRDNFQPHAVILTERTRREPIFVAATIGSARLLRIDLIWAANLRATSKNLWKGSNAG